MANLKLIKSKILSYKKTGTVTHAMEAVSAVKMRKGQERALSGRSYAASALSVLERLSGTADLSRHPMMQDRVGKTAVVVITSDKGLAGGFNSGVIRAAENLIQEKNLTKEDAIILAFGRKGGEFFKSRGFAVEVERTNVSDDISESELAEITRMLIDRSDITTVFVVYQNFISTFEQQPISRQIVPIKPEVIREIVAGIRPARGRYAPQNDSEVVRPASYTVEPDAETVLSVLLPKLLNIAVFHALLESKASEHSARMVAMKSATDKARDMAKSLTRIFNKVRQAAITREVSEITSGMEAMK
ncbi:MAG: synthase gamma chain [Candidatus Kaiserbacteria bacterium]|nr:synthase gamma chain [Candidatus Kaiserbacteria bacterium]